MKKFVAIVLTSMTVLAASSSFAADRGPGARGKGLGIMLGEPSGINGKYFVTDSDAFQATVAYSFLKHVTASADYIRHFPGLFGGSGFVSELSPYVGVGATASISTDPRVGGRIPLGAEYFLGSPSLGFFAEVAPGVKILPSFSALVQGGIGFRYYF